MLLSRANREVLDIVRPGGVLHAGTYNANLISLAGAYGTMSELKSLGKSGYERFHNLGKRLIANLRQAADIAHQKIFIPGFTGWFLMYFTEKTEFKNHRDVIAAIDNSKFSRFAWEMMRRGIYVHPDSLERINVSFAHTEDDNDRITKAATESFRAL